MNWKEIAEKYPKAWSEFEKQSGHPVINKEEYSDAKGDLGWYYNDGVHSWMAVWISLPVRNLYDFFDEHELFIEISLGGNERAPIFWDILNISLSDVYGEEEMYLAHGDHCKSRTEAETEAFEKSFELLEQKLSNG